jgi:hypothetical protein
MRLRANDPLYELGFMAGGGAYEDWFWSRTLENLAGRLGTTGHVTMVRRVLDGRRKWRHSANLRQNAALRTFAGELVGRGRRLARRLARA